MPLELLAWLFVWVWGSYHFYHHKRLLRLHQSQTPTSSTSSTSSASAASAPRKNVARVHYREKGKAKFYDVPGAKTEAEAVSAAFRALKGTLNLKTSIDLIEWL